MITLYQYYPAFGLPNPSPFCMKVETYLKMAEIDYSNKYVGKPSISPKGRLPCIGTPDQKKIADSVFILDYLENVAVKKLDSGLSDEQLALSLAVTEMLEHRLYWLMVWDRWISDSNWKVTYDTFFKRLKFPYTLFVPGLVRSGIRKRLEGQGTLAHSKEEIVTLASREFESLSALLGDSAYLHGNKESSVDATLFAFLANILFAPYQSEMRRSAMSHQNLVTYCQRMQKRYYEDLNFTFDGDE